MRQDYLDTCKSSHTSLHVLDWSLDMQQEPPFQIKNQQEWELGEIDVAAQSPKRITPWPRRHRVISRDNGTEEPQNDEGSFDDIKPNSLTCCFETTIDGTLSELPILSLEPSFEGTSSRPKRSRDESCDDYAGEEAQLCGERQRPLSRKRRRVGSRNNALCAQDYDDIFSQLGC
ncbi:unnamed protein product [Cylindrotheca closterium]|uniref:Uncharacterized protein n=1 Tax=Cylindrotheca closterium TaxID=2856 RepID=A0AAD2FXD9_9STRA|nr:unnamed protein product [Cylindrotheca closterium]